MISYVQADARAEAMKLSYELGQDICWLDVNMDDKSEVAMEEAVRNSDFFVGVLSPGYFKSKFCCKEMMWAHRYGKTVVTCYPSQFNVGPILQSAPDELEWVSQIDSKKLDISDKDLFAVGVSKLLKACGAAAPASRRSGDAAWLGDGEWWDREPGGFSVTFSSSAGNKIKIVNANPDFSGHGTFNASNEISVQFNQGARLTAQLIQERGRTILAWSNGVVWTRKTPI